LPSGVDLPTRPTEAIHAGEDGHFAVGLAQKLIIVRPFLLVAWAGSKSNADRIVRQLDGLLPATFDEIDAWDPIWDVLNSCVEDSEMIALIIGQGMVQPLGIRTGGFDIDGKRVYLMGSGRGDIFEFLTSHPDIVPDDKGSGLMATANALRFGARAIAMQWVTGTGIESSWGGGFEVAYPEPDGFRKIDRILFRAWKIDADDSYINSGRSFFVRYYGDDLYLSARTESC